MYTDKQWLEEKYLEERLTHKDIANLCGVVRTTISKWCKRFNIETREIKGCEHPNWKGGRYQDKDSYWYILKSEHPRANKSGYILEHILITEEKLGRYLKDGEVVHHIDGDRTNNNPSNLYVCEKGEHHSLHWKMNSMIKTLLDKKIVTFKDGDYHL